jgi:O-antigen ligase
MSREGELPYAVDVYHTQPHSIYFAVLVDCGVVGIGILLSVFILPVYIFFQRIRGTGPNKPAAYAGLVLAWGYIHFGLTETIFGRNLFVAFFVVMLAMLMALTTNRTEVNY